ncbi:hypothetical protein [Shewanella maritima]|uniref:hypothetical protein n=1 Tax=Shewanella maritima TaxID=2520507 RepID=UPI0037355760
MLAVILSLSLAMILAFLWYAGLKKRRQSAISALKLIHQKMDLRMDLLHSYSTEARASWSANYQKRFNKLTQLEAQSEWNETLDQDLGAQLSTWQKLDTELNQFIEVLDDKVLPDDKRHAQEQLASDIEQVQNFYNQTVSELNSGVRILPCDVVAKVTNITPLPSFSLQTA